MRKHVLIWVTQKWQKGSLVQHFDTEEVIIIYLTTTTTNTSTLFLYLQRHLGTHSTQKGNNITRIYKYFNNTFMSSERSGFVPFQKIHRRFTKDVRWKHLMCICDSSRRTLSDKNNWWSRVFQFEIKIQIRISSDVFWPFVVILWCTHHTKILHYKTVCLLFNSHVS